jgi:hypothetical protein
VRKRKRETHAKAKTQRQDPIASFTNVCNGSHIGAPVMYCQSRQMLSRPSPSFPFEPPKILVNTRLSRFARQNTDIPVKKGTIVDQLLGEAFA